VTAWGAEFARLVDAARSGGRAALDSLLAAAQPDVRRYARAACRTASDVDDAVQDALCVLYRRVGTIRSAQAVAAWLMVVARRECLRLARRAGRGLGGHAPVEDLGDDLRLSARPSHELRLDLAAAIQSLPAHYRDLVILRDVEELTIDEMARARGLTREAVKARLHRARALLREYLKD
jgi:RNA polymerase sigma-70 factor (ECF subfamily)